MKLFLIKIQSLSRLGILNVFNVLIYRFKVKFGISSACSIKQELDTQETYFDYPSKYFDSRLKHHQAIYFDYIYKP